MRRRSRCGTVEKRVFFIGTMTLLLTGCSAARQIALFGDSLSWEAQPYYGELAHAAGDVPHTYESYGGTAICDWLTKMTEVEAQHHPKAVQLEFSGNNLTPCMEGYEVYSPQYYEKYRADTMSAIQIFTAGRAHVFLVGAPINRGQQSVPDWQKLNMLYQEIAAADPAHVTYVDAGTAVELPEHVHGHPPVPGTRVVHGPVVDGVHSNVVRSADGGHFCPTEKVNDSGVIGGCPVYSSGAYRYANAMVNALTVEGSRH